MEEKNLNEQQKNIKETTTKENGTEKTTKCGCKKGILISGIIGILIGMAIMFILGTTKVIDFENKVIAKTNVGEIKENDIFDELKEHYTIELLLENIDKQLLEPKYSLTEEQEKEIDNQMGQIFDMYSMYYGLTQEQFLTENGFNDKEEFREYLAFDYKRNLQYLNYIETLVSEDEIKKYYDEKIYGEINTKHMLVQVTDKVTEKEAKKMAEEIIKKLNDGKDFDKVAKEYGDKIIFEELGYNGFNSGLVTEYVEASKKLENGKYSKEPVKTEYGYHVIYRIGQKEKPTLDEVKNEILAALSADLEAKDANLRYKAFIKFREENGLKIEDSKFKKEYKEYCEKYNK